MRTRPAGVVVAGLAMLAVLAGCSDKQQGSPVAPGAGQPAEATPSKPLPTTVEPGQIEGITHKEYPPGLHVSASERVNYKQSPPFGGSHDGVWAACNGAIYPKAIRTETLIHSLEHGAVWIAVRPDLDQASLQLLAGKVKNKPYTVLTPYPGLDRPISLQSWGYQLKVDDATDPRIDQFIAVLRQNQQTTPEPNAPCDPVTGFDPQNPPPFDPSPPGPDAVPDDKKPPK